MIKSTPELNNPQQTPILMLEDLALREGAVPDENGESNFMVGAGVHITIYGRDGSPHAGSEGCLANMVGALRQGEADRTVQVYVDGLRGWTHGHKDEGQSEQIDGKDCVTWFNEVCTYKPKTIAA